MNRRALLKFLLSAPAAAAVGLGTLVGRKKVPTFRGVPLKYDYGMDHSGDALPYSIPRFINEDVDGIPDHARYKAYVRKLDSGIYRYPNGSEIHYKPVSDAEERRVMRELFNRYDKALCAKEPDWGNIK